MEQFLKLVLCPAFSCPLSCFCQLHNIPQYYTSRVKVGAHLCGQSVLNRFSSSLWYSHFCFVGRLHDQMVKINQSLHRLQVAWREAQQSSSPATDSLREQFERLMTVYLSTKTSVTEPQMLQNCLNLQVSMAVLLVQLAVGNRGTELIDLTFPLSEVEHSALAYVPGE